MEQSDKYIVRDLSWLDFNARVLGEAQDEHNPLLERLKFLAIFASNLDEFYMVRIAGMKKILESKFVGKEKLGPDTAATCRIVEAKAQDLLKSVYSTFSGVLKPALEDEKIYLRTCAQLNAEQKKFIKRFFDTTLFPIITPMAVDQGHPFPMLPSKTIAYAVSILRSETTHLAIVPVPKAVPRLLRVPQEGDEECFVLTDDIIREHLKEFFKGYKIQHETLFRVLRDSELEFDEEFAPNLLKAMEKELKKRSSAPVISLQIHADAPTELVNILCSGLDFPKEQLTIIHGDFDLTYLFDLSAAVEKPSLRFHPFSPAKVPYENIFDKIKDGDFITHMPFQSFYPTVDLVNAAAKDPDVLAIKMTLYRTGEDSAIIKALMEAAKQRKQVTVVVEIKARFEEEKNIQWARELEQAGCHVIYGIAGLKIHSKMTLVVRKEDGRIRRYVHLSTGNYNEKTAKVYTDIGFYTANDDFARDIADVFNVVTGYSQPSPWKRVISSPHDLRKYFFDLIDQEMAAQSKDKNGWIIAKMNSLEDKQMIDKLYQASQAGVKIKLLVRGICCLKPGVVGLSENIEVRSIVGRFLEHSRIYIFGNGDSPRVFLASADWMTRNFDRRVELLFELTKPEIKKHVQFIMDNYWKDTRKTRRLSSDGMYSRVAGETQVFDVQEYFIKHYTH